MADSIRDRLGRVVTDAPDHQWAGDDHGHDCIECGPDGPWRCDFWAHWIPLYEDDPVAHRLDLPGHADCAGPQERFHGLCGGSKVCQHLAGGTY